MEEQKKGLSKEMETKLSKEMIKKQKDEKRKDANMTKCVEEINKILKKYNCSLGVNPKSTFEKPGIVINHK